jgi:hypothetical protein
VLGSALLGAWIIGWMPIGATIAALHALFENQDVVFSSLTRKLPVPVRMLYEFGGFPFAQFVVLAATVGLLSLTRTNKGAGSMPS